MVEDSLNRALEFTVEDLAANRNGFLSSAQRLQLEQQRWKGARGYVLLAAVFGVVALIPALRFFTSSIRDTNDLIGACIFGALTLALAWTAYTRWQQIHFDAARGTASVISGIVRLETRTVNRGNVVYKLKIQGLDFQVSEAALQVFTDGETYRVYYAPESKIVLSAEPEPFNRDKRGNKNGPNERRPGR